MDYNLALEMIEDGCNRIDSYTDEYLAEINRIRLGVNYLIGVIQRLEDENDELYDKYEDLNDLSCEM